MKRNKEIEDHYPIESKLQEIKDFAQSHLNEDDAKRNEAAKRIQRVWRGRNKAIKQYMDPDTRWMDASVHAKLKIHRSRQNAGINSPKERWKRVAFLVTRLQDRNAVLEAEGLQDAKAEDKHLETQHWLELVDAKHRYGSNRCWYHRKWQDADTSENLFHWLDRGGGKDLSLDECSREQLEKERITYLSAEQRLNYLVKISDDGKLLWARNGQPIDTSAGKWKDSGNGKGIIPEDAPNRRPRNIRRGSFDTVSSDSSDSSQENAAAHYLGEPQGKTGLTRVVKRNLTIKGLLDKLLRKTVQRNTWIYVTDKNFNIFIGIKETGSFQHSSFLGGGIVSSAGLISVKQGTIHTLSPLSGHYRTTTNHFHHFIRVMRERGVDMRKARISKAEAALWGIEHIAKAKKKKDEIVKSGKDNMKDAVHNPKNWKQEILEGRKSRYNSQTAGNQGKGPSLQATFSHESPTKTGEAMGTDNDKPSSKVQDGARADDGQPSDTEKPQQTQSETVQEHDNELDGQQHAENRLNTHPKEGTQPG